MGFATVTPAELAKRMEQGVAGRLLDVREPVEWDIARIDGSELFPLSRFNEWIGSLRNDEELVVICHHGIRSAQVCSYLAREGFTRVSNLSGGVDRWSYEVDPAMPRY